MIDGDLSVIDGCLSAIDGFMSVIDGLRQKLSTYPQAYTFVPIAPFPALSCLVLSSAIDGLNGMATTKIRPSWAWVPAKVARQLG